MNFIGSLRKFKFNLVFKIIFYFYYATFWFLLFLQEPQNNEHQKVINTGLIALLLFLPIRVLWEMFTEQITFARFLIRLKEGLVAVAEAFTLEKIALGARGAVRTVFETTGGLLFLCVAIVMLGLICYGFFFVLGGIIGLLNFGWKQL